MDQELRKEYNKNYYQNNKTKILEKLTSKVNCEFCNRQVSFANLQKHYDLLLTSEFAIEFIKFTLISLDFTSVAT